MDTNFSFRHPKKLHLCRLCLLHKDSLVNIHERNVTHGFVIAVEISDLLQLNVFPGDGLPDAICFDCLFDLSRFKRFKRNSHEAEVTLKYILNLREVDSNSSIQTSLTEFKEENSDGFEFQDNDVDSQTREKLFEANFLSSSASEIIKTEGIHQNQHPEESGGKETELCFNETENLPEEKVRLSKQKRDTMEKLRGMPMERTRLQRKYSNLHMAIKEENVDYDCDEGNYSSKGVDHARMDIVSINEDGCQGNHVQDCNVNSHSLTILMKRGFICDKCGSCFKKKIIFERHLMKYHSQKLSFSCGICCKTFLTKGGLKEHLVVHSTERPFMCDICGSTFKLRKKLLRHIRTCHSGNS
ncbi:hypothetical protein J437_LFUL004322 [Ladona fulva]|uniref:Uncharacterized protein n=1 Tax=Ladona fulva TaxID=123851 RepID=A0A8K0K4I1_LADFU|nr:hypothetical protein J437_LFUL004322 [Ladona fulva]